MRVSILIPTYRDWPRLLLCLDALAQQSLPREAFEIIVIDNDANHQPPPLPAGVRCLHAPQGYSYAARNAGAASATGELLAFTDADCLPDPDWLAEGLASFAAQPDLALLAGRIEVFAAQENAVSRYENLFEFQQAEWVRLWRFGVTANLMVRRPAFDGAGGFNAAMKSGGDSDFCRRCQALGLAIGYAESALVRHPSRETLGALLTKNRRVAAGYFGHALQRRAETGKSLWAQLPFWWRLRAREWLHILSGARGSRRYAMQHRFGVLGVHMLLHYHTAFCMLRSTLSAGGADRHVR